MAMNLGSVGESLGPFRACLRLERRGSVRPGARRRAEDSAFLLEPSPRVLPTFAVIPAFEPVFAALRLTGGNLLKLLHTGQRTKLVKPLPAEAVVSTTAHVLGIWDMRIGALVNIETRSSIGGELHARTVWSLLMQGEGGFESPRPPAKSTQQAAQECRARVLRVVEHQSSAGVVVPPHRRSQPYPRPVRRGAGCRSAWAHLAWPV